VPGFVFALRGKLAFISIRKNKARNERSECRLFLLVSPLTRITGGNPATPTSVNQGVRAIWLLFNFIMVAIFEHLTCSLSEALTFVL